MILKNNSQITNSNSSIIIKNKINLTSLNGNMLNLDNSIFGI